MFLSEGKTDNIHSWLGNFFVLSYSFSFSFSSFLQKRTKINSGDGDLRIHFSLSVKSIKLFFKQLRFLKEKKSDRNESEGL
jgi:hypothetical protein